MLQVETTIRGNLQKVWDAFTQADQITHWYFASNDWHAPKAENHLVVGGKFLTRMEAKDGSFGFDLTGVYTEIELHSKIAFKLDDGRMVEVKFVAIEDQVKIIERFEPENQNPPEMQLAGWQAILHSLKTYVESK